MRSRAQPPKSDVSYLSVSPPDDRVLVDAAGAQGSAAPRSDGRRRGFIDVATDDRGGGRPAKVQRRPRGRTPFIRPSRPPSAKARRMQMAGLGCPSATVLRNPAVHGSALGPYWTRVRGGRRPPASIRGRSSAQQLVSPPAPPSTVRRTGRPRCQPPTGSGLVCFLPGFCPSSGFRPAVLAHAGLQTSGRED